MSHAWKVNTPIPTPKVVRGIFRRFSMLQHFDAVEACAFYLLVTTTIHIELSVSLAGIVLFKLLNWRYICLNLQLIKISRGASVQKCQK